MEAEIYKPRNEINYSVKITENELNCLKEGVGLVAILNKNENLCIIVDKDAKYARKEDELITITPYEIQNIEKNRYCNARFDFKECRELLIQLI